MQSTGGQDNSKIVEFGGQGAINSVFFAEDGKQVVSGDAQGFLRRWRADDGRETGESIRTGKKIFAAALSSDRKWLVCGFYGSRQNVKMWDADNPQRVLDLKGHADTVTSVDFSCDSSKLATGSNDKHVFIWSMESGRRLFDLRHDGAVVAVRFSPQGDRIATATADKSICIYDSGAGRKLLDIPCPFFENLSSPLAWSADGRLLYAASYMKVKRLNVSTESWQGEWSVSGGSFPSCLALSRNQKFVAVVADRTLSFWDATTHKPVGSVIRHASRICSMILSPDDDSIMTGDQKGKITLRRLRGILPGSYLPVNARGDAGEPEQPYSTPSDPSNWSRLLTLTGINTTALEAWKQGNFANAEQLLTQEISSSMDPSSSARALAHRAFVRARSKLYVMAIDDARKSLELQRSVIGRIALAIANLGHGKHDLAELAIDRVFHDGLLTESSLLWLIKAIILFECGKHDSALSRVCDLVDKVHDKSLYVAVQARMYFLLGRTCLGRRDYGRSREFLQCAREAVPFQTRPHLVVISLIFGWEFDGLDSAIEELVQKCTRPLEEIGDAAVTSKNSEEAIKQYSAALALRPPNPAGLLIKRGQARADLKLWGDAAIDADEAIKADPQNPCGYKLKHVALHTLQRYDEAVNVLDSMSSLGGKLAGGGDHQLANQYADAQKEINMVIRETLKICPFVLVDVKPKNGHLCDATERTEKFRSESQYKELVSSMTLRLDIKRIRQVVEDYFRYVTFSHVWEGKEPSYQDVKSAKSVWELDLSFRLNKKLHKFCEVVHEDGYRWAWSDTCCINKEDKEVLYESLHKMYKWYEDSAATFALLANVDSTPGGLKGSKWMTRAWTSQELLAPKLIRFYDRNWKPYLGDTRTNHKDSPEIMKELADTIGLTQGIIRAFNPDELSVREKLRLVSKREATKEEDIAYSLIGIFKSDIRPHYGEGYAALGHLLEEIVARSTDVSVLAWAGKSSEYNSCLPATLHVYSLMPHTSPVDQMDRRVGELKGSISQEDATRIYDRIINLPPARFAYRRLHLPCIIFTVQELALRKFGSDLDFHYHAAIPGIGFVDFHTSDKLPVERPEKFILVHPWIRTLHDPLNGFIRGRTSNDDESKTSVFTRSLPTVRTATIDDYTRALRLLVRLKQPFQALLLQQQSHMEFKRVAPEHEIVVCSDPKIDFAKDVHFEVVEVL